MKAIGEVSGISVPDDIARVELLDPSTGQSEPLSIEGVPGSCSVRVPQRGRPFLIAAFVHQIETSEKRATVAGVALGRSSCDEDEERFVWRSGNSQLWDLEYLFSTELAKDSIHLATLEPKGRIPETFLDVGEMRQLRVWVLRAYSLVIPL